MASLKMGRMGVKAGLLAAVLMIVYGPGVRAATSPGDATTPAAAGAVIRPAMAMPDSQPFAAGGGTTAAPASPSPSTQAFPESVAARVAAAVSAGYWAARPDTAAIDGWTRGPLYRLRRIEAVDERDVTVAGFGTTEWTGESVARLTDLQVALQEHLARDGFVFSVVRVRLRPDPSGTPDVDVVLQAQRGAAFKLGNPVVRGTRTRPEVVRRLALWEEGENLAPRRIERGVNRLARLGYYESVDQPGFFRDSTRNVLYPLLNLRDARANTLGGLLGYDTEAEGGNRLTGFLDVHLVNMRGTARDFLFAFDGRRGREREASAAYTEPWILGLPVGVRWEGRYLQQDTLFWEWQQALYLFRDLDFFSRLEVEFGTQANRDLALEAGTSALFSGVRVLYDSRDRVPFTRSGARGGAGVTGLRRIRERDVAKVSGTGAADSVYYLAQLSLALERWVPLTERFGLKLGGAAATNLPLDRLNHGESHHVGGARSLRGYRERQFQTNAYALTDVELQFSVGRRARVFGFASPGVVNRPVGHYDLRRVLGYGAGLEIAQGDWSVALTYALNPERVMGDGYLHAAVENRF